MKRRTRTAGSRASALRRGVLTTGGAAGLTVGGLLALGVGFNLALGAVTVVPARFDGLQDLPLPGGADLESGGGWCREGG